jgi:hypothetical protein
MLEVREYEYQNHYNNGFNAHTINAVIRSKVAGDRLDNLAYRST